MAPRNAHPLSCGNAVKMVFELRAETRNARGSIARVGERGIDPETLRNWVQKARSSLGSGRG